MTSSNTAFITALENGCVHCQVVDIDYQRSFSAFGAVDTHYIINVRATQTCSSRFRFKTFSIEKSFHNFRSLVTAFKKASKIGSAHKNGGWTGVPESTQNLIAFSDAFAHVIDSEPVSHFIGKMTFSSVQELASQRRNTLNKALSVITENYPASASNSNVQSKSMKEFQKIVFDFFLTDHIYEENEQGQTTALAADASVAPIIKTAPVIGNGEVNASSSSTTAASVKQTTKSVRIAKSTSPKSTINGPVSQNGAIHDANTSTSTSTSTNTGAHQKDPRKDGTSKSETPSQKRQSDANNITPQVRPKSVRKRMSTSSRKIERRALMKSKSITFNDNDGIIEEKSMMDSPITVFMMLLGLMLFFLWLPRWAIEIDVDVAAVAVFACITIGMKCAPQSAEVEAVAVQSSERKSRERVNSEVLMRKSLGKEKIMDRSIKSSLGRSLLGSIATTAGIAYDDYEEEETKRSIMKFPDDAEIGTVFNCWSEPICNEFKVRGPNYLKDKVKVASGPFLFPARGVDVFLSDCCPEHIARYKAILGTKLREKPTFIINYRLPWGNCVTYSEIPSKFLPFLRYCYDKSTPVPSMEGMTNAEVCACRYLMMNEKGKDQILKIVPKVVKGPWIVKKTCDGKPAIVCNKMPTQYFYQPASEGKAEYLEVDLDIVASSTARAILSVAQRYTKSLTLDLGFVFQSNSADELPEQMAFGARLHGLDPLTAPMLPQSIDGTL